MQQPQPTAPKSQRTWFVSWRWRIVIPLFTAVFLVATVGAFVIATQLGTGFGVSQDNLLLESMRGVDGRANALYRDQLQEAQRVAFTIGVPEAVQLAQVNVLRDNLEALARAAELDSLILTDVSGVEVLGVQRTLATETIDYTVNLDSWVFGNQASLAPGSIGYEPSFFVTVPTPASAAILGMAGLAATRRRR